MSAYVAHEISISADEISKIRRSIDRFADGTTAMAKALDRIYDYFERNPSTALLPQFNWGTDTLCRMQGDHPSSTPIATMEGRHHGRVRE